MCRESTAGHTPAVKPATARPEAGRGAVLDRLAAVLSRLVALITLVILMPLLLLIGVVIIADSGLPVLFRQERIGLHGRRFRMLKFRKFHAWIGRDTAPLTEAEDPRCTRVGRLLAKTKLDELPQLWNVIVGDMAVVGPRPEVPDFEGCFSGAWRPLLTYRPGIFGPSQVVFHSEASFYPPGDPPQRFYRDVLFPAKAGLDLAYYRQRSIWGDIKWILRGILVVFGADPKEIRRHRRACLPARNAAPQVDGEGDEGESRNAGATGRYHEETRSEHGDD